MNILLINHYAGSPWHGMEYRPYYLAREWVNMGHNVTIVASSFSHLRLRTPRVNSSLEKETIEGIVYFWLKTPPYKGNGVRRAFNIFTFVGLLWKYIQKLISDSKPDIVISSSVYLLDMIPARRIAQLSSSKLILEVHDLWPLSLIELGGMPKWHPFIMLLQWAENYSYRHADKVVSILPNAETHMIGHGMAPYKFIHIPNGVDVCDADQLHEPLPHEHEKILGELRAKRHFIIGYAGAHGIANALRAFIMSAKYIADANVALVLVGRGPEKTSLQNLAKQIGPHQIFFLPPVPKQAMPELLGLMDVLYIGGQKKSIYRFGISPNKLVDYMMAGRPIIHAIEATNDLVQEARCGISVEPENPEAIGQAIRKFMAMTEDQRKEMGLRGKNYVMEKHDYRVLARRFLEAIM